jgi:glycosyltransferase involved in cell wall biosynthesis
LPFGDALADVGDSALVGHGARALAGFGQRAARAAIQAGRYALRLRTAIAEYAPSIVHSNGVKAHLFAAAVKGPWPLVWHVRDFVSQRPVVSRGMRVAVSRASAAIAISRAVAEDARGVLGALPLATIHNGIDTQRFAPAGPAADLDTLAGCAPAPPGALRVGLVATYARWKGHDIFLRAARAVAAAARAAEVCFYVVGGPIYVTAASQYTLGELRTLAADLGIKERVRFVPFQANVEDVYRALDIVVHASSRPEPFGRTIAEAMSTGKAVIASREGGAAELFSHDVDAIAVPARDPAALADALLDLIAHPTRRGDLGARARLHAVEAFSRARLAAQVLAVYHGAGCTDG